MPRFIQNFWMWFKQGKVKKTTDLPLKRKKEKFKGLKITWPWPGNKDG